MFVQLTTSQGDIILELDPAAAPKTTANFIQYVQDGHYNGTIFHRVIPGFMIQGGGMDADLAEKPTCPPIENEARNGLANDRYTVAMARTPDPHSATAQFFINTKKNDFLDFTSDSASGWGYAVFGRVIKGQEVVDAIENTPTASKSYYRDMPVTPITILKAEVLADYKPES
ncbi:MAG: peptidyl-prolyl cis-trans isomerase [Candidatus Adiutrix sp.]|nr:peptidyl-prolyl cis-trans isomerase [Candidatus Adiutrix sp.]